MTVAIAIKDNNLVTNIKSKEGNKKECINFLNECYNKYLIDSFLDKEKVVICLTYNKDKNDNEFYNKKELVERNLITLI